MATSNSAPTRRRRTPQAARQEILDAASALLAERPAHEVTVLAIMQRTTLSRKSFYVYFRDRSELILTLVRPLRREADAALATWRAAPDAVPAGRAALRAAAELYRSHGAVLRAVFWSSVEDPDLEAVRADLTAPIVEIAVRALRRVRPGTTPRRARATGRALVTMNVHSLLALRPTATDAELDRLVDVLADIWERTLGLDDA